ncbi:transporter [Legionella pneumophila]|uniref:transporter n=1 Tax=Legionella pneumophila TaxID=446 RepID=UPI000D05813E|nr:transporter [Legionella pneumophila]
MAIRYLSFNLRINKLLSKVLLLFLISISHTMASEQPVSKVTIPGTVPELLQEMDEYGLAIYKDLEMNRLSEVRQHAFVILDLINALPELSQDLSPKQLKNVQSHIDAISHLIPDLIKSSDANDKKTTQRHLDKMQKLLNQLHTYYLKQKTGHFN